MQQRLDAQRVALVDAASGLLAEGGYGACTVAAVADRAGVAAGTVYRHFASKAELAAAVFELLAGREVEAVRVAAARGRTAADRIRAVVETFAGRALREPRRAYALLAEPVDPAVDALRLEFRRAFRDVLADAVAGGVHAGELPEQEVAVVAAALVGAIGEALVGPLADGTTAGITPLVEFAHRAVGVVHAHT